MALGRIVAGSSPGPAAGSDDFDLFIREQRPVLIGYLCRRVSEEDAKDVAQEAMERLLRYRDLPIEQLRRLMYRIALNVLHDRGRRENSHGTALHVSLEQEHELLPSLDPTHEQRIDAQQQLDQIRDLVLRLPDRCREVYLLNRVEGMSYAEIAEHFDISVKAVEKNISRALRMLREGLVQTDDASRRGA
jgi:RNA polymerase sigma-70 factor (ECF subfamily)